MPTYEYQCKNCEHRFEIWQKMADDALTTCPECKGVIRRIFFPAGIVFKGSGFYKTDHGSGTVANDNSANNNNGNADTKENTPKAEGATESKASSEKTGSESKTGSEKASVPASESKATAVAD
ncbi:MAG: FmdB family zinc ribbon protein [Ktedonobacteraceae bacterium]